MAYQVEIKFLGFPPTGTALGFTVQVNNAVFLEVAKTFGPLPSANVVSPGATIYSAMVALRDNLHANNAVPGVIYSLGETSVYVTLPDAEYITVQDNYGTPDYVSVYILDPEVQGMAAVNIYNLSIEIIDTYDNGRSLIEEYTQPSSPKLVWDGGDDIYSPMMPSNLVFNMAVPDAADAKFLHLLTGDENRYLVKVRNTDTHDVKTLLWQGFILPDLYSEPWKSGVPFIEFTAIDMLASLKTKTFDPWFYQNTFNLPELFGYILLQTGLQQEMYIRPCLVNVGNPNYRFRDMNISLKTFTDGKKYTNLYEMLEKLLTALGMCIYSYRGKWFLVGLTRRFAAIASARQDSAEVYYPDGVFKQVARDPFVTVAPDYTKELPVITAKTPWKSVNLNFESDSEGLYPEGIVVKKYISTEFTNDFNSGNTYADNFMDNWQLVGIPFMVDVETYAGRVRHEIDLRVNDDYFGGGDNYNVTEVMAMANYYDCKIKPYIAKERLYELEYEVEVTMFVSYNNFEDRLNNGDFDNLAPIQIFNGSDEIISNRPSYIGKSLFVYDRSVVEAGADMAAQTVSFKLKREFVVANEGTLSFRVLPGIAKLSDLGIFSFSIRPRVLQVKSVEELEDLENAIAVRDIKYTQEMDVDMDYTVTVDSGVKESFGIAYRTGPRYIKVNTSAWNDFYSSQLYLPSTNVMLELRRWPISKFLQDYIFMQDNQKGLFWKRSGQKAISYDSIFSWNIDGVPSMAVYKGYNIQSGNPSARPTLPAGYKALPGVLPADDLILMTSLFSNENKSLRALWKIMGFPDDTADSYMKTLARACHAVRPDVCFSMDATALALVFPEHRPVFLYNGQNRVFVPVRMELDLSEGKTSLTMVEWKLSNVNDISYE